MSELYAPIVGQGRLSAEFAKALVQVQGNLEGAKKDTRNDFFKAKYADLSSCWDACREAIQSAGIAVLQFPCKAEPGFVGLLTVLVFGPTGETLGSEYFLPLKDVNSAQAAGSAITYARRYALCAVLGICPEDDDGTAASAPAGHSGPRSKEAAPAKKPSSGVNASGYRSKFDSLHGDYAGRKALYTELKNSGLEEPAKTALLAEFANEIKSMNSAANTKEDTK